MYRFVYNTCKCYRGWIFLKDFDIYIKVWAYIRYITFNSLKSVGRQGAFIKGEVFIRDHAKYQFCSLLNKPQSNLVTSNKDIKIDTSPTAVQTRLLNYTKC